MILENCDEVLMGFPETSTHSVGKAKGKTYEFGDDYEPRVYGGGWKTYGYTKNCEPSSGSAGIKDRPFTDPYLTPANSIQPNNFFKRHRYFLPKADCVLPVSSEN